ncbi:Oidioi.mRNA.OKI2018_I69.chr2.g4546.t1.cds [Oikopleura dioica]|uniref:Oidioi.mRNA.OKI2018_I69.chr2.g4546.t1.cds n=1 Tax=Oikopleura dioica TaxID=34765 RepID=A0ABN7T355_OIKDI|nr:Oidioi.mRNA.OKI2018_I69.chr2.g4546.t1.cds [Oikopleura dioica]
MNPLLVNANYAPTTQQQILLQQQQLLLQEIAIKRAQLLQQHQQQLAQAQAYQQAQVAQAQTFATHKSATFQPTFITSRKAISSSPELQSSGTSSPVTHHFKTFDSIEDHEIPSPELQRKITQQVEYYFSNEYLTRDAYFLRQIRRKREGYLSMKLITNFKKVRKLSKDPRITSFCLRKSKLLQVNEEGSKVRRIQPIPEDLRLHTLTRSILVSKIPSNLATIDSLMNVFFKFGEISSVRILRPGKEIPHDLREFFGKSIEHVSGISAVVEFETPEGAAMAYNQVSLGSAENFRDSEIFKTINVVLLGVDGFSSEDDSGCGESSGASGDECVSSYVKSGPSNVQIPDIFDCDLDDDYEAYMNQIRQERQSEAKTAVPSVIASLMDEYGACSLETQSRSRTNSVSASSKAIGSGNRRANSSTLWSSGTTWNSTEEKQLKSVLNNSALSAFGQMKLESDDVFAESNLIAPALDFDRNLRPANLPNFNQNGAKCWADAVRK